MALVGLYIIATLLSINLYADETSSVWTKEQAAEKFNDYFFMGKGKGWGMGHPGLKERHEKIKTWHETISENNIDLGEEGYLLSFSTYMLAGDTQSPVKTRMEAGQMLADFVIKHGGLSQKAEPYNGFVIRMLPGAIRRYINEGQFENVGKVLPALIEFTSNAYGIYSFVGSMVMESEKEGARAYLMQLLGGILTGDTLSVEEKNNLLVYLYGGGEPGETAVSDVAFVPFEGPGLDGKEIKTSDFAGKVLLIDFWATWCRPCMNEMPHVVSAYEKYKDQGLEILGVSLDGPNSKDKIKNTMEKANMTWPQIYDGDGYNTDPAKFNNVNAIPMTVLLDRSGVARYRGLRGEKLHEAIEELLQEKPAPRQAPAPPQQRGGRDMRMPGR